MRQLIFIISFFFSFFILANDGEVIIEDNSKTLNIDYMDPGHKQKQGKDGSKLEMYLGLQPSFALKLNFSHSNTRTEKLYMMLGMDFDTDIYTKFGIILNPGQRNKNRSLFNPEFGWWKLWRYVMVRQALELGYKGQFLDAEEDVELNTNYGGVTANYSLIFDGNFLFDKTAWYFMDHRTARRIRLKVDVGVFCNLDKFNQPTLGLISGSNNSTGFEFTDDNTLSKVYPVISPFVNFSIGFAF